MSEGSETIAVIFRPAKGNITYGGNVIANHGCWTLLKGGMVANFSTTVDILFEVKYFLILKSHFYITNLKKNSC